MSKVMPYENAGYVEPAGCCSFLIDAVVRFVMPTCACTLCFCIPTYNRHYRQRAQIWLVQNPTRCKCCRCCFYCMDMSMDCTGNFDVPFRNRKKMYGQNSFCAFNKLVIQDPDEIENLLLNPQKRGYYLGFSDLIPTRKITDENKEDLYLLGMTDGENSRHIKLRNGLKTLIASRECLERARPRDPVMKEIIALYQTELRQARNTKDITDKAVPRFLIRALHWCVLEMNLVENEEDFRTLFEVFYGGISPYQSKALLWNIRILGTIASSSSQMAQFVRAEQIYMKSRLIQQWEVKSAYSDVSKVGIARMIISTFTTAGLQGPLNVIQAVLINPDQVIPQSFEMPLADTPEDR